MSDPEQLDLLDWLAAQPPDPRPVAPELALSPAISDLSLVLTRVDLAHNMRRFYSLALATSLFGEAGVVRRWGRIGSSGQSRTDWYSAPLEAETALQALLRAKRRRGYVS